MPLILFSLNSVIALLTGTYANVSLFITHYGYAAVIFLMTLGTASLPVPSELILPIVGAFIASGALNPYLAFMATIIGTIFGISIDYFIAYFLGKELVYKHLHLFHIKRQNLDAFDRWFEDNGPFAVFVSRLIPVVRGVISLPAGFARMNLKKFYLYSIAGAAIWNTALIVFGYYALSTKNAELLLASVAALAIVLYLIYHFSIKRIRKVGSRSGRAL